MHEVLEQVKQEQEKKRRTLQQLQAKRPNRGQRARRNKARRPEKQQHKDADEEPPAKPPLVFLYKKQVLDRIPVSGPRLWNWSRTGKFPTPRFIGSRTVWVEAEVDAWMEAQPKRAYKDMEAA
jgi:predicted DNA-binding transcriptional regulator AlpA